MSPETILLQGAFALLASAGVLLAGAVISYVHHFGAAPRVHHRRVHFFDRWHAV